MYRLVMNWIPEERISQEFETISDIRAFVYGLHERYDWIAGSTWGWNDSKVYSQGKLVGSVSYNGRVWTQGATCEIEVLD